MPTGTYKLQNIAYLGQYVSLVNDEIVGHSQESGIMVEWFAQFHEGNLASFQVVRNEEVLDKYIYYDSNTQSLTCSNNPWLFFVKEHTSSNSTRYFSIDLSGDGSLSWTLTSSDENSPIKVQRHVDSNTEQLWQFEK